MAELSSLLETQTINSKSTEFEIDFIDIIRKVWNGRKLLFIYFSIGIFIGIFFAIIAVKEYSVSTIMVPQSNSTNKSQLSGLASLAGLDMGMMQSSDLSPIIYPKIVKSIPFKLELMNTPIYFVGFKKPITILEYYTKYRRQSTLSIIKKYTIGLPILLFNKIGGKSNDDNTILESNSKVLKISKLQYGVSELIDNILFLTVEKKDGYLTLTVNMPDAYAAAQVASKAQEMLQRYITSFKIEKSKADLDFIQSRYNIAKSEAENYQVNIAINTDKYKNLTSNVPQVTTTRIQTKYSIANNLFMELAKQLEQAKIQVKKDTPIFTIIEPVVVPSKASKPNRVIIFLGWVFFSLFAGSIHVLYKFYINRKNKELHQSV